ncbi:hypothetical protein [Aquabacterium sp.]|uniref:hypothetical protein n=1 Tax=Aquabacterium sp. TaxID=1872578 RepID=UPI002C82906D|nr:hypothetical protein [Aquabacterium sp.]HSW07481.1 hypothetical protein [Aquabacterium sp.]
MTQGFQRPRPLATVLACSMLMATSLCRAGPTEAAHSAASAVAPVVKKTEDAVKHGVKKAASAVEHGAKVAASAVNRGAKKIGLPTGPAASSTGRGETMP